MRLVTVLVVFVSMPPSSLPSVLVLSSPNHRLAALPIIDWLRLQGSGRLDADDDPDTCERLEALRESARWVACGPRCMKGPSIVFGDIVPVPILSHHFLTPCHHSIFLYLSARCCCSRVFYLITMEHADGSLKVPEAERRLTWFINSLYMRQLPDSASVLHMPSFTVVTPQYNEAVIYGKQDFLSVVSSGEGCGDAVAACLVIIALCSFLLPVPL